MGCILCPKSVLENVWLAFPYESQMGVSINGGTPKSSILVGFSLINHPFWVPPLMETSIDYKYTSAGRSKLCYPEIAILHETNILL